MNVLAVKGEIPQITRFATTLYRVEVGDYVGWGAQLIHSTRLVKVVEVLDDRLVVEHEFGRQEFWLRGGVALIQDDERGHTKQVWPIHERLYKDILHFREQDILFDRLREAVNQASKVISGAVTKPREGMTMQAADVEELIRLLNAATTAMN